MNKFFDAIKEIPYKNCGGCLFFCYVFWLWLKQNKMDTSSFQIVQIDWGESALEQNKEWIKNKNGNPTSSFHFVWSYDGKTYDSCGEYDLNKTSYKYEELTGLNTQECELVEEFCVKALKKGDWNKLFDRNEAIKDIKTIFGFDLTSLKV